MKTKSTFCTLVQAFFTGRLMGERNASPHTIANYRDTFRLLIAFAERKLKKAPTCLMIENIDHLSFLASLAASKRSGATPHRRETADWQASIDFLGSNPVAPTIFLLVFLR